MIRFAVALMLIVVCCVSVEAGIRKNRKQRVKILHPFKQCHNGVCNLN